MKVIKFSWLLLAFLFTAVTTTTYAAELKVGVVNAALVLDKSPQKAAALQRLEKEFLSRSKTIENKHKQLLKEQEKLQKDAAILSTDERKQKERQLLSEQRELKRLQDEYSEDLSIRRNEELRKLEKKIAETIVSLAESEKYDLVIYQGVIFASDAVDITDKVLAKLKAK